VLRSLESLKEKLLGIQGTGLSVPLQVAHKRVQTGIGILTLYAGAVETESPPSHRCRTCTFAQRFAQLEIGLAAPRFMVSTSADAIRVGAGKEEEICRKELVLQDFDHVPPPAPAAIASP